MYSVFNRSDRRRTAYLLAHLEHNLLQEIRKFLHNRDWLTGSETHSVHWSGGVVARFAQPRRRITALLSIVHGPTFEEKQNKW